ncbi:MAG TPA: metallophosphoesterase [Gemmatimonadaceae bacterium]|nr:metallophosphoesterase [Gemmatimonadaceae bacterium]
MQKIRSLVLNRALAARLAFITVWFSLFAYAGRPLLVAAHVEGVAPAIAWVALFGCSLLPILPAIARRSDGLRRRSWMHWTGYVALGVFSLLLVLVALSDVVRLLFTVSVRTMSFSVLLAAGGLSLVGFVQARFPRIKRVSIAIDNLPAGLDGYRIVQLSDVHVGPTIQRRFVQTLVDRTNALHADAIAVTGDLIDGYVDELRGQVQPFAGLCARDGVFYVTGNHEYYWRASEWIPEIERLGFTFLKNEARLARPGLVIAGVTDPAGRYTHRQDLGKALSDLPDGTVKVLLSHRPQTAKAASRFGVDLQLSGHTHGGQFFPFNLLIRLFQPIVAGLHRVDGTWLYVSRGTGYWGPPSRLGVHGEITVITLTPSRPR